MMFRVALVACACLALFFVPLWIPLMLSALLALRYAAWEVLLVGFVADVLFAPHLSFAGIPIPATLVMFLIVAALIPWRRQLAL